MLNGLGTTQRPTVAAVIPVWNEEAAIGHVISAIPRDAVDEIVVVDAGSRDATVDVATAAGARVVVERRRGYGRACASGVNAASAEIVVFFDGDGSDDPSEVSRMVAPLLDGRADLVLGTRKLSAPGAMPVYARAGNLLAAGLISLFWGQRVTDLPSCKAIRRSDLLQIGMTESSYGWTIEMIVKAARRGYRMTEVPLIYRPRMGGESKVSGNPRASIKAAFALLRVLGWHGLGLGDVGRPGRFSIVNSTSLPPSD